MGLDLQADLQIPDLWYDFYSRLLPGLAFVLAFRAFILDRQVVPSGSEMLLLLVLGYISGLVTQPVSSRLSGMLQNIVATAHGQKKDFVQNVLRSLGDVSNERRILSKMHGEVSFFLQGGVLSLLLALRKSLERPHEDTMVFAAVSSFLLMWLLAYEVADRRLLRALRNSTRHGVRADRFVRPVVTAVSTAFNPYWVAVVVIAVGCTTWLMADRLIALVCISVMVLLIAVIISYGPDERGRSEYGGNIEID